MAVKDEHLPRQAESVNKERRTAGAPGVQRRTDSDVKSIGWIRQASSYPKTHPPIARWGGRR